MSVYLTKLLRHDAVKENLTMDSSGYVLLDDIKKIQNFKEWSIDDFLRIVEKDKKNRYSMIQRPFDNKWVIRANQ